MSRLLLSQLEKTHLHILDHLPCDSPRACSVPKHGRQQSRGALTSTNLLICLGLFGRGPGCLLTSSDIRKGAFSSPKAETRRIIISLVQEMTLRLYALHNPTATRSCSWCIPCSLQQEEQAAFGKTALLLNPAC